NRLAIPHGPEVRVSTGDQLGGVERRLVPCPRSSVGPAADRVPTGAARSCGDAQQPGPPPLNQGASSIRPGGDTLAFVCCRDLLGASTAPLVSAPSGGATLSLRAPSGPGSGRARLGPFHSARRALQRLQRRSVAANGSTGENHARRPKEESAVSLKR